MVRLRILNRYQWNNDQIIDQNQITGIVTYKGHVVQDPNQKVAIKEFSKEELGETAFNEMYANQVLQYECLHKTGKIQFFESVIFEDDAYIITALNSGAKIDQINANHEGENENNKDTDNTKLSSSFQPSYDDVGKAWEKDNGCNDTASEKAIEEDWIIVEGPRIGNPDGEQHQQGSMLQNGTSQQQTCFNMPQQIEHQQSQQQVGGSNEAKVVEVFNAEVSGGSNEAKIDEVFNAGVLGGSNEARVDKIVNVEVLGGSNEAKIDEANGKGDVEDSSNAEDSTMVDEVEDCSYSKTPKKVENEENDMKEATKNETKKKFAMTYLICLLANILPTVLASHIYNSIDFTRFTMVLVPALIIFCLYLTSKFLSGLFKKIDSLENQMIQFNQLTKRIDSLENKMISFNQLSQKIDSMEHEDLIAFEKLSKRIDSLETEIASNEK